MKSMVKMEEREIRRTAMLAGRQGAHPSGNHTAWQRVYSVKPKPKPPSQQGYMIAEHEALRAYRKREAHVYIWIAVASSWFVTRRVSRVGLIHHRFKGFDIARDKTLSSAVDREMSDRINHGKYTQSQSINVIRDKCLPVVAESIYSLLVILSP